MLYTDKINDELPIGIRRTLMMKVAGSGWYRIAEVRRTPQGIEVLGDHLEPLWDGSDASEAQSWVGIHGSGGGIIILGTSKRRLRWPKIRRSGWR